MSNYNNEKYIWNTASVLGLSAAYLFGFDKIGIETASNIILGTGKLIVGFYVADTIYGGLKI